MEFHSGGGISGGKHVRWEYLTANMKNFKSGVDSSGRKLNLGGKSPFLRFLYEKLNYI